MGQEAEQIPHCMQCLIFSPPGIEDISSKNLASSFIAVIMVPSYFHLSFENSKI
jgi:hypothetical protein